MKIKNQFYNEFDTECFERKRKADYRTPFEIDRDRVIHTFAFRKLQSKTQVFLPGEYDFYRTRLTHSIEVAQIGRSICTFINRTSTELNEKDFYIDPKLVEAVCLTHDIGHPPFGHAGERKLNQLLKKYGGFEGNAQTLHEITENIYSTINKRKGFNPTRAYLDGVLKYKRLHKSFKKSPKNHFLYDEQKKYIDFVFDKKTLPSNLLKNDNLNNFKSLECEIMDWSDDIAFSINDIIDGITAGFLNRERVEGWFKHKDSNFKETNEVFFRNLLNIFKTEQITRIGSIKMGDFIKSAELIKRNNFMSRRTNRYKYSLMIGDKFRSESKFYKNLALELIFELPQIKQLEFKGEIIIENLFNTFVENYCTTKSYKNLLPREYERWINESKNNKEKILLIRDYIAGMTDRYAIKIYNRMFMPDSGSILDLI